MSLASFPFTKIYTYSIFVNGMAFRATTRCVPGVLPTRKEVDPKIRDEFGLGELMHIGSPFIYKKREEHALHLLISRPSC